MFNFLKSKLNFLFWKYCDTTADMSILEYSNTRPFKDRTLNFKDSRINESFNYDNQFRDHHIQFILSIRNALVEPEYGFVIVGNRQILKQSVSHDNLRPSVWRYLRSKWNKPILMDTGMLFDGHPGVNYFHFFADTINKLWVFEKNLNRTIPLLIAKETFNSKYFQGLVENTFLGELNWVIIEKNQYFKVSNLYIVKPNPYEIKLWQKTLSLLDQFIKPSKGRRIFLDRSIGKGRYISNMKEIIPVLNKYHFELVDTDGWSLEEQIVLFSETEFLIGLHGAGLTNIMFSYNNQLRIIEINPPNRIACQYYWLADIFGYRYNCILGDDGNNQTKNSLITEGFSLSPQKLEEAILVSELN